MPKIKNQQLLQFGIILKYLMNMKTNSYFEDILQSDDELPTDYEDVPIIPAYKMENRFEPIKFRWIDSNFSKYYQKKLSQSNVELPVLYSSLNEDILIKKTENLKLDEKPIILNRVLALQDIFCLKSVESSTSDTVFLWFINFLLYKDMQSKFSFLKTCLASFESHCTNEQYKNDPDFYIKNYNYDLVSK